MDSNASFAGEVEPNVSRDNDFFLRDSFLRTPQLVIGQSAMSSHRKRGSTVPCLCWHWSNRAPTAPEYARPNACCRASLKARRRSVTAGV